MLYTIIVILILLWLVGGFAIPVGGSLIHLLLVIAVIIFVWDLLARRRRLP